MTPTCHPDRKHRAHGMCDRCYQMAWRHGSPTVPPQPRHCFGCGRETDETPLTEASVVKRPVVGGGRHYVSLGRMDICPRCVKTLAPPRRKSRLRVVTSIAAALLLLVGCSSPNTPELVSPVASASPDATASPVSTTGSPSAPPATPRPGGAGVEYVMGGQSSPRGEIAWLILIPCSIHPASWAQAIANCDKDRARMVIVDPATYAKYNQGDVWEGPVA